jgi:hypothetical protein
MCAVRTQADNGRPVDDLTAGDPFIPVDYSQGKSVSQVYHDAAIYIVRMADTINNLDFLRGMWYHYIRSALHEVERELLPSWARSLPHSTHGRTWRTDSSQH